MALTSTLFTGLSGLQVNQSRLNVTGNNIANVNTVGFKASRALAKPQFYVTDRGGSSPGPEFGGTNPDQRGLGALVASIDRNWETGALETTGRDTDLAIDGQGFFVASGEGNSRFFTRDGSFSLNQNNKLVTSDGKLVQGFAADAAGNVDTGGLTDIEVPIGGLTKAKETSRIAVEGTLDASGVAADNSSVLVSQELVEAGGGPVGNATPLSDVRRATDPGGAPLYNAGDTIRLAGEKGGRDIGPAEYTVRAGDTVATLAQFFNETFGISNTAAEPGVTDAGGNPRPAGLQVDADPVTGATTLAFIGQPGDGMAIGFDVDGGGLTNVTNPGPGINFDGNRALADGTRGGDVQAGSFGESARTSTVVYDTLGNAVKVDLTFVLQSKDNTGTTWRFNAESADDTDATFDPAALDNGLVGGTGTVKFDTEGLFVESAGGFVEVARDQTGAGTPLRAELDFSQLNAPSTDGANANLRVNQDGKPVGTLTGFSIGENGIITGTYDNQLNETLGQVALAVFDNPGGLQDLGGSYFAAGANSGDPGYVGPLDAQAGSLRQGTLEASNVDLSNEFINMIVSTTGFSAASRVITTSDELLNELIASVR